MSARTTALVVERELREGLRRKSLWALFGLIFLGSTALMVLPQMFAGSDSATIVLVGADDQGVADALTSLEDITITIVTEPDREAATEVVKDKDADLAVVLDDPPVIVTRNVNSTLAARVRSVVADRLLAGAFASADIDSDAVAKAFAEATPTIEPVDAQQNDREAVAVGVMAVLYILTVVLTSGVASAVAIEKSNRVSEVLLAIVPPRSLLFGKVLGIGAIGMLTVLGGAVPVVVRFFVGGDLPTGLGRTIASSSLWFAGGLALYLMMAGGLGALAERQEEAGALATPLTLLLVAGYLVALTTGDGTVGAVLAYVPFVSPMVEPYRIAIGVGPFVERVVSLIVLYATVVVMGRLASTVFRRGIVRTGRRLHLRDVL